MLKLVMLRKMLSGQVALVTGGSRGIGRGISLQLGEAGATVYITGRTPAHSDSKDSSDLPTLQRTAEEVTERGGKGVAVYCDHGKPEEVQALFQRIQAEQDGRLDILVNNAYSAVNAIGNNFGKKFYESDPLLWDEVNNVGLRNHYVCAVYAARMMVKANKGLIVTISSAGGMEYMFNVAYGVGKAACDRMAKDMAHELQKSNICSVSLWPGAVRTELFSKNVEKIADFANSPELPFDGDEMREMVRNGETVEYSGKCVVALASDKNVMCKTGRTIFTADLGDEYNFIDVDGRKPGNMRSAKFALQYYKWNRLSALVPSCIKVPTFVLSLVSSKF